MNNKIIVFCRRLYSEYKLIIISYAVLIVISLILFPGTTLRTFSLLSFSGTVNTVINSEIIYIPLLIVLFFIAMNIIWRKKFNIGTRISVVGVILFFTIISGLLVRILFSTADAEKTFYWSTVFMNSDRLLFGTYPAFFLFDIMPQTLEYVVIFVYLNLPSIIILWIIFLLIYKDGKHLNLFINQYFLAFALCFPLWIIFSAICPAQMYVTNILNQPIPLDISALISKGPPSEYMDQSLLKLIQLWTDPGGKNLAISTFPSMHTIWGILLAYSIFSVFKGKKFSWLLIGIGVVIMITNMIGATYLLQHYVVDLLAGALIAIVITKLPLQKDRQ